MAEERILDDISHRRFNALRNSWVLVSPHRTKRPWQGQQEAKSKSTLPEYDPQCYLCPGNARAAGDSNPNYDRTFVFVNDYSAVKEEQPDYSPEATDDDKSSLLLQAEAVKGKCFVICFNPKHNLTLADIPPASILPIIDTWTSIYQAHLPSNSQHYLPSNAIGIPSQQYTYMQIFENKGAAMGCSNPHPHGQVWTTTSLPEEPALEISSMTAYRKKHTTCLLCDYVQTEINKKERIVYENENWLAVVPWWATWPFEILLLIKSCKKCLPEFVAAEKDDLAKAISQVTKKYDNLFETSFPYSMGMHQAPLDATAEQLRKFLVGYEMLAEPQRDITPEQAAKRLRDLDGVTCYRQNL